MKSPEAGAPRRPRRMASRNKWHGRLAHVERECIWVALVACNQCLRGATNMACKQAMPPDERKNVKYAYLTLISLFLVGCGVNKPIEGRADPYLRSQIHFDSADLANKTAAGAPMMERRNGILYVTVPIRSAVDLDLHIDYRVTFVNEAG